MHPTQWLHPAEHRRLKTEQAQLEAEHAARAGRSLVTDKERATLPQDELARLAYGRWMAARCTVSERDR